MADKRINALANTAPSTASDDFIAVDGTTNGTRKLNAFSPTFGGNATVTGTLTVSGTGASSFGGRLAIGATALSDRMFYVSGNTGTTGASQFSAVVNPTIPNTVTTGAYGLYLGTNIATGATVTNGYSLFIAAPDYTGSTVANKYGLYSNDPNPSYFVGNVLVGSTTASTSTSTGALVVGNGTSGGLGVGGDIRLGGSVFCLTGAGYNTPNWLFYQSGSSLYIRDTANAAMALEFIPDSTTPQSKFYGKILATSTTASTSTSSGALVVSGGVGVAGAIYAGAIVDVNFAGAIAFRGTTTGTDCQMRLVNNGTSGRSYSVTSSSSGSTAGVGFHIWDETGAASALSVDASRNTTLGGSIKTSAPSGGTAAAWKLGTVATVSPTSPNRTIEVDIGGTIYYLAAKTTNN